MPSSLGTHVRNSTICRVQSTGDIPQEPQPLYKPQDGPHSACHADLHDGGDQADQGSSSSLPANAKANTMPSGAEHPPPAIWTAQPITIPLGPLQAQHTSGPVVWHVAPIWQHNRFFYRRSMAFLGLGRGASLGHWWDYYST